jgi:DNA-binding MarR family transcriptional regulator
VAVSDLEAHVGFWLRFVSNHVSSRFKKLVEDAGVSVSEWVALRQMFEAERSTPKDLMGSLGMTKGAISKVLDRLERKELARRVADPADGRALHLELTRAGRALVPRLAKLADDNDEHFFGQLSATAHASLVRVLKQIVHDHQLTDLPID